MSLEKTVFDFFNSTCHNIFCDWVMPVITRAGTGEFLFIVAVLMLFGKRKVRFTGILMLAGLTLSHYVVHTLKELVQRPRPFLVLADVNTFYTPESFSFPSGHSTRIFMMAFILSKGFGKWYLFYAAALVVALSRPYLGVHYPSDIATGAAIGTCLGYILVRIS